LKIKELAFLGAKNELVFERKKGQSNPKKQPGIRKLWGIEWRKKLENGNWKLETGAATFQFSLYPMKSESENWGGYFQISSFQFPVSAFSRLSHTQPSRKV